MFSHFFVNRCVFFFWLLLSHMGELFFLSFIRAKILFYWILGGLIAATSFFLQMVYILKNYYSPNPLTRKLHLYLRLCQNARFFNEHDGYV